MIPLWKSVSAITSQRLRRLTLDGGWVWIALPLAIIYVLGVSMQGLFSTDFTPARPYQVAVAGGDASTSQVIEAMIASPDFFSVDLVADEDDARASVLARRSDAAVIVPPDDAEQPFRVIAPPGSVVLEIVGGVLRKEIEALHGAEDAEAEKASDPNAPPSSQLSSFEYFGVGIMIMFLMFTVHSMMVYSVGDRSSGAYGRIRTLGVSRTAYLVAGYAAAFVVGVIFAGVMALATRLIFGVEWGDPLAWTAVTLAGSAGVASISFLIMATMPPSPKAVESAGSTLIIIMSMMGGSTVPLAVLPSWFADTFAWLPNRIVLDGYFAIAAGGSLAEVAGKVALLLVVALCLLLAGWSISVVRAKGEA